MTAPSDSLTPGFIALHGHRSEVLLETVAAWLARHPLAPLEKETILVHSNGMAEWVKMTLARKAGICAAVHMQLPARFLWQLYRQLLGRDQLPPRSSVAKNALSWRLMKLLPDILGTDGFAPLADYLAARGDDSGHSLYQLATRIADLYDQYQVHRPDWLAAWQEGSEVLLDAGGRSSALDDEQCWQARLWQQVVASLPAAEQALMRPQLHERALAALEALPPPSADAPSSAPGLPRRVVVFGITHLPQPSLQILAAMARHSQILLAIPNPCRFHWADIIDGREWLQLERRRQPLRDQPLAAISFEQMHLHAHPLLAAWGRQGRDFVRQLDAFDDAELTRARFPHARIDLFDTDDEDESKASLLQQVQAHIRDLLPLAEHPQRDIADDDRSIVFHVAHSPLREVEILHDQLLQLLATPPGGKPLQPRDIVVMVPEIDDFAAAIRAVFGQYGRHDPRYIPFDIADLGARDSSPLLHALQWLLQLPRQRGRLSEITALLDVPAIARRFGLDADDLPRLSQWLAGAGVRWGLDETHRDGLGLGASGATNSALFGLRRMLMGYAVGSDQPQPAFGGIQPYDEIGGLDAELAGAAAHFIAALQRWLADCQTLATPAEWGARLRQLLEDFVLAASEEERHSVAALHSGLEYWLEACSDAGFDQPLPLTVAATAWLDHLEQPALQRAFRAGGVTFCTLLPMRAIPFEVVCLLGMNEGDYPRRGTTNDFDLIRLPAQRRPGDRARRDDDRQLMLEALMSARRQLYLSWCGRSQRDNSPQPASVLVSQLRDYLAAGWSAAVPAARTTEHPLQPFSRRYFEAGNELFTHAREWRAIHADPPPPAAEPADQATDALLPFSAEAGTVLSVDSLANFIRNPVRAFFQQRLGVRFSVDEQLLADDEAFSLDGLEAYRLIDELLITLRRRQATAADAAPDFPALNAVLQQELQRLQGSGQLPLAGAGEHSRQQLELVLQAMLTAWLQYGGGDTEGQSRQALRFSHQQRVLEDSLVLHHSAAVDAPFWLAIEASILCESGSGKLVVHRLVTAWLRCLLAAAGGKPHGGVLIGRDASLLCAPIEPTQARQVLGALLDTWQQGMNAPLPLPLKTALAYLQAGDGKQWQEAAACYSGNAYQRGESEDPYWTRSYPEFAAIAADSRFAELASTLYPAFLQWAEQDSECIPHRQPVESA